MPGGRKGLVLFVLLSGLGACSQPPAPTAVPAKATPPPVVATPATNPAISEPEAALLRACEKGDVSAVKELLEKGVNVNARDKDGRQPVIEAAYWQHADVVRLLIDKGADVNAKKVDGTSALEFAILLRNKEIEQMLRQAGAKVDPSIAAKPEAASTASPAAKTK